MPEPMLTASAMFANAARFADAYHTAIAPLCASTGLPPAAADILLFLANNSGMDTAKDICTYRHLKPAIVSFHVDNLVREGYLARRTAENDRRKIELTCTPLAQPVIEQGRTMQKAFLQHLLDGMDEGTQTVFFAAIEIIDRNMDALLKEAE